VPRNQDTATARASAPDERGRLSRFLTKPPPPGSAPAPARARTAAELKDDYLYANDKERVIGLIMAPVAAAIAFALVGHQLANNPAQYLLSGAVNPRYTPTTLSYELLGMLLALSVGMLALAFFRRRLYLGMVFALYGIGVFNLHWWGFGFPFVMIGAWYLVTSYRATKALKEAGISPKSVGRKSVR
jgi:hypothetical protein